jgi:hypothetical protein
MEICILIGRGGGRGGRGGRGRGGGGRGGGRKPLPPGMLLILFLC